MAQHFRSSVVWPRGVQFLALDSGRSAITDAVRTIVSNTVPLIKIHCIKYCSIVSSTVIFNSLRGCP